MDYRDIKTSPIDITCRVTQGSVLVPLLFISYISDLYFIFIILQPIMFTDDSNIFPSHRNIKDLLNNVDLELNKTSI